MYNYRDNAKLMSHGPVHYKIEWICKRTKVRGPDSLVLALIMKKKERLRSGHFFEHLVLVCTTELMILVLLDNLLIFIFRNFINLPVLRYLEFVMYYVYGISGSFLLIVY